MSDISYRRDQAYNMLPKLPPVAKVETERTLKRAVGAGRALAELKGVGRLIPNQGILIRAVVLQEARLSSEIENIVTTNDELYRAFGDMELLMEPSTREVIHYEEALWHGYNRMNEGRPLNASLFSEIASIIKATNINIRTMPGTQIQNDRTREVVYTPPSGESLLHDLLHNLSKYLYEDDSVDPLIKMAVAHYQFEAIHPFPDGNGRTGRIINILYLIDRGMLDIPVLDLSGFIIQNKADYYRGLQAVTERGDWESWVDYLLKGIEQTAITTKNKIVQIRTAIDDAVSRAQREMRRGYSKELVELVYQQPYTRIKTLHAAGIAKRQAASEYLKELEHIGILRSEKRGRDRIFLNHELMEILTS